MSRLRTKLVVVAFLVQFLVFGALMVANELLLEPWFVWWASDEMNRTFQTVLASGREELPPLLRRLSSETGFRLTLSDEEGQVVDSSVPEFRHGQQQFLPKDQRESFLAHRDQLRAGVPLVETIDKEPRGQSVISSFYRLREGVYFNATMPLGQIRRNVTIASELFLGIGLFTLGLTLLGIFLASGRIVRPIQNLDALAKSLASRDFRSRYQPRGNDELDHLGESMNRMADQLREALEETEARSQELAARMESQQLFFASVSHELKTPLGLIRGYGEILQGAARVPKASRDQAASIILDEADRLARMVDDLLTLTRLGRVEFGHQSKHTDLPTLIVKAAERFQEALKPKGLSLVLDLPSQGEAVLDETRMLQALDNVLSNAIRHAIPGSAIEITLHPLGEFWDLAVTNQGVQIEESNLERIFEPFFRVDQHRNRNDGGSGLGLSIVAEVLRMHGGSVTAANTGRGVTIHLRIPRPENQETHPSRCIEGQ